MSTNIRMSDYPKLWISLKELPPEKIKAHCRNLARTDLYFLIRYVFNRTDFEHEWLFERCREVEQNPNGNLDLWARDHRKSTIITYAKTIQDILASHGEDPIPGWWGDRELTVVIFSFNRPSAKKFLDQIKNELETNALLKEWFPDVLYSDPQKQSPKWSLDEGLLVRRKSNPKEKTIEAYGIIDSMPTGGHWMLRVYDDVITEKVARSPDIIKKSVEQWELSLSLGTSGPGQIPGQSRYIGTRYAFNDAYRVIMDREAAKPRIYPATDTGKEDGKPVFLTYEELRTKRREMGVYTFACQMLQNPNADETQGFKREWLRFAHELSGDGMNKYILVDPAGEKKKENDYTVMVVIGLGADSNYYLLDMIRDRLNLNERTKTLFRLHAKWRPLGVGYEKYGKDSDIEHITLEQNRKNYRFNIDELGGRLAKNDRIKRLIPSMEEGRFYLPSSLHRTNYQGKTEDLVETFLNDEYDTFPVPVHDDMLDAISRIFDIETQWPQLYEEEQPQRYARRASGSWMGKL